MTPAPGSLKIIEILDAILNCSSETCLRVTRKLIDDEKDLETQGVWLCSEKGLFVFTVRFSDRVLAWLCPQMEP